MTAKYHNVSLHSDLIKEIDRYINESNLKFRSRAELLTYAFRRLLNRQEENRK